MCVRKVSQVGAEQAGIELQVVIMERLGTAAKLAVHLAQVSQVDQLPQVSSMQVTMDFYANVDDTMQDAIVRLT